MSHIVICEYDSSYMFGGRKMADPATLISYNHDGLNIKYDKKVQSFLGVTSSFAELTIMINDELIHYHFHKLSS